ncbi:MAG: pilin [Gammaproteobacteria bacterium]|nr:pilin [Gammaproteobacteria bacterium]
MKTAIEVAYSEGFALQDIPTTAASIGVSPAGSYTAEYVSAITYAPAGGIITIELKNNPKLGGSTKASATSFQYIPTARGGNLEWRISAGGGTGTQIPDKYLPKT